MEEIKENAASSLVGRLLKDRWKVLYRVDKNSGETGGKFSIRYVVEDITNGNKAFLKALNYKAFFMLSRDKDPVSALSLQNSVFEYERAVLERCRGRNLSRVTRLFDTGTEYIEELPISAVPYLIFEMADGDVRSTIDFTNASDIAWKLGSLHNVAVGVMQLHGVGIGHQDLKPSNVLLYEKGLISKIGDLGNSLCSYIKSPFDNGSGRYIGDGDYVPIEFLYGFREFNSEKRRKATDMYLFGNLVCFYFTGLNMTSLILKNIDKQFRPNNWNADFRTVKEYLMSGFYKGLKEFQRSIPSELISPEIANIVQYCCFPYPEGRGHPIAIKQAGSQYDFQRIITRLDVLRTKMELHLRYGH